VPPPPYPSRRWLAGDPWRADRPPGTRADAARGRGFLVVSGLALLAQPPRRLIAEYTATFGVTWRPVTRRKHAADFVRPIAWLEPNGLPVTTASLDFLVRVDYVGDLRVQPKVSGVWRGAPTDEPNERSLR